MLTDQISDLLFMHSPEAREHLVAERRPPEAIHDVANTMIDTLVDLRGAITDRGAPAAYGVQRHDYVVVTLYRPALVDGPLLAQAVDALSGLAEAYEVVFPLDPRTRTRVDALDGAVAAAPTERPITVERGDQHGARTRPRADRHGARRPDMVDNVPRG